MQERPHYRISVVREGWSGGLDELAEMVALRFSQPTIRVRQDLQRAGRFDVPGVGTLVDAQRIVAELLAAGVSTVAIEVPRAGVDGAECPPETFLNLDGARTLRDGELAAAGDHTLVGMARGSDGDTFVAGRGPAVIPEIDAEPEGAESLPEAWRAVASASAGRQPVAAHPLVKDGPGTLVPSTPPPLAAAVDRGWSAVLGSVLNDRLVDAPPARDDAATIVIPAGPEAAPAPSGALPRAEPLPTDEPVDDRALTRLMQPKPRDPDAAPPVRERRYERLRPPPGAESPSTHSPLAAGLWSLVAPGAGQAYNGDLQRGISFAIAGLLIVPWFWSILDAVLRASDLRARGRVPRTSPLSARLGLIAGFWAAAVVVVLGASVVIDVMTREPIASDAAAMTGPPAPRPVVTARPARPDGAAPEVPIEPAEQLRLRQQEAAVFVLDAQTACGVGDFVECRRLAEAALALDDRSRAAQRIHAQAIAGVFRTDDAPRPGEGSSGAREGSL